MKVIFNKKRTLRELLSLLKYKVVLALKYIPKRLTAWWRKSPDFIIIGVMKGGTTSLYDYLNQHPDVQMSREKEVNYFSMYYYRSKLFYKSFFSYKSENKMAGEASPFYFFHPQVPVRIKRDLPQAKIILILRDPVLRAYSQYNHIKGVDSAANFDEAIQLENKRVTKEMEKKAATEPYYANQSYLSFSYFSKGLYFKQLSNWLKHYKKEELLILKSEDLFENPKKELKKMYQYLGLKEVYPSDLAPKNQRFYKGLSEKDYLRYKEFFKEDAEQLKALLGNHFTW